MKPGGGGGGGAHSVFCLCCGYVGVWAQGTADKGWLKMC